MDLPNDDALRRIVASFAGLRAAYGKAIGEPALVQPTGEFFPDHFTPDAAGVDRMLRRMLDYAPVSAELAVELAFFVPAEGHAGGCGSAACGPGGEAGGGLAAASVQELDDGYRVVVSATDVGTPALLGASLSRSIGSLILHEAGEPVARPSARSVTARPSARSVTARPSARSVTARPSDPAMTWTEETEMAAIVAGFGVLLANGAAVWAKSCGGLRMAQATLLPIEEIAVGLALFVAVHRCDASRARKHLGLTQREAFEVASDWVDSNPMLVDSLRDHPDALSGGAFDLEPIRGIFGQWLHKRKIESAMRVPVRRPSSMSDERRRRIEEVAALLDETAEPEA
jgi:hypothetical protein